MNYKLLLPGTVAALSGTLFLSASLLAQPAVTALPRPVPKSPPPPTTRAKGKTPLNYKGDIVSRVVTPQGDIDTVSGNAWFRSEDSVLTTALATLNRNTKIASSPGKLKLETQDATITANTGTAFYNTKDIQARGQIVIVIRPRPQDKNAPDGSARKQFDSPATITCEKFDYNWRSRQGVLTGNLIVKQKNRTVTADKMLIDAAKEIITLIDNVKYKTTDGDDLNAIKAIIVYREGAKDPFTAFQSKGILQIDSDEETPTTPGTPTNTPAPEEGTPPANPPAPPAPGGKP